MEKNCLKSNFRDSFETCNKWPKWQDVSVDIKISSPRGCQPLPGAIYIYKIMKKLYIIRLQRNVFETCSKWPKWQEVCVDIRILSPRVVCPWPTFYLRRAWAGVYICGRLFRIPAHAELFDLLHLFTLFLEEFDYSARVQHVLHTTRCSWVEAVLDNILLSRLITVFY